MVIALVEKIIGLLKDEPDYRIKSDYGPTELAYILMYRGLQIFRGVFMKLRMRQTDGLILCGRRVIAEYGHLIVAGPGLILEDDAHLNALSKNGFRFGRNVTIARGAVLTGTGVIANKGVGIAIGDHSAVGAYSYLGGQGGITIGNDVIMGPRVCIFSENHNFDNPELPIRKQGETRNPVAIEDDCWIGAGAMIMAGVTVGRGSVVAAGATVTKDVPPYSVVAGVPGRVIKKRTSPFHE